MAKKIIGWTEKLAILAESKRPGSSVLGVARTRNLQPQTLRRWRREWNSMSAEEREALKTEAESFVEQQEAERRAAKFEDSQRQLLVGDIPPFDPGEVLKEGELFTPDYGIDHLVVPRRKFAVEIHGKLPRGDFDFLPIALPKDLRERLEQEIRGSKSQAIVGLVRFALDALKRERSALHIYNEVHGIPAVLPKNQEAVVDSTTQRRLRITRVGAISPSGKSG